MNKISSFLKSFREIEAYRSLSSVMIHYFGEDIIEALSNEHILESGTLSKYYISPKDGLFETMFVERNEGDAIFPYMATPQDKESRLKPKLLEEHELMTLELNKNHLFRFLSDQLNLDLVDRHIEVFKCGYKFAQKQINSVCFDVVFTMCSSSETWSNLMIRKLTRAPILLIINARQPWTDERLESSFIGDHDVIRILFLEDVLYVEEAQLKVLSNEYQHKPTKMLPKLDYCKLVSHNSSIQIDEDRYHQIISAKDQYDLILDLMMLVNRKSYYVAKQENGALVEAEIQHATAWAYAELMEKRRPLRPTALATLVGSSAETANKHLQKARRLLDVKVSSSGWQSTLMLNGEDPDLKLYQFAPPEDLKWILLRPLEAPWDR